VSLVGLVALSAVILTIEWLVLGRPSFPHPKTITSDAIKIGLAIIAGLIAAVGLTVSYRKQRGEEEKGFTDRYESAAEQLGHEKAAVRLAGVYAMARLADDWEARRQTCIDVLCAYLRMPYDADHAPKGEREVRRTILRLVAHHLGSGVRSPWAANDFDFEGAVFDFLVQFEEAICRGFVNFSDAKFMGYASFRASTFDRVRFAEARSTIWPTSLAYASPQVPSSTQRGLKGH
jgi:hypothetical protein